MQFRKKGTYKPIGWLLECNRHRIKVSVSIAHTSKTIRIPIVMKPYNKAISVDSSVAKHTIKTWVCIVLMC